MKLKQLLILGALLLSGSASAAIVDGVRQAPATPTANVTAQEIKYGEAMYMYNVQAGQFFLGANDWSTRASVGRKGYKVFIDQYSADGSGAWDGKQFYWRDSVETQSAIKHVFMADDAGNMWVDNSGEANRLYNLIPQGNNVYRITPGTDNPSWNDVTYPGVYVGAVKANTLGGNTRLFWNVSPETEGAQLDWIFVSVEEYAAQIEGYTAAWTEYDSLVNVYNVALNLKTQLDVAKSQGLDVAAQEAVYLNEASSVETLEEAIAATKSIIAKYEEQNVDPSNPVDKTSLLANPDYTDGKTGWSDSNSDWAVSYNVAEHYDDTFNHYQDVKGAPAGVYALTLRGYCRPSSSGTAWDYYNNGQGHDLYLYASNATDTSKVMMPNIWVGKSSEELGVGSISTATDGNGQTWYVTNNMQGAEAYFNHEEFGPKYDAVLFFGLQGDSMRVGIRMDSKVGADWALWDNWRLTYYGGKAEAYQMWLDNLKANAPKFPEDAVATAGMIDEYNSLVEGLTGSTYDEIAAAMATLDDAAAAINKNIELWQNYADSVAMGLEIIAKGYAGDPVDLLGDYVEFDAEDIMSEMALTSEELVAEMAKLSELIEGAKTCVLPGTDVTKDYLINYNFEHSTKGYGWNGSFTDVAGPSNNKCMEAYEKKNFDIYQVVKNANKGVYEISFNGFFRNGPNADAYAEYQALKEEGKTVEPQAWVYVNNNMTPMKNCYDEEVPVGTLYSATEVYGPTPYVPAEDSTGYWYPNGMADAGTAFAQDMYKSTAYGIVVNKGDELRIGVKGNLGTYVWAIWDNFKMVYLGNNVEVITPLLEKAIADANTNLAKRVGKEVRPLLSTAIAAGEAALGTNDGDQMFAALSDLFATNDTVNVSVAAFNEVYAYAETIFEAVAACENAAIVDEAMTLAVTITEGIDAEGGCAYATSEIAALNEQIALMLVKLNLPAGYENASDDNPVDMSKVLMNGDFGDAAGVASADGWQGAAGALGGDFGYEFYMKTFDLYQDIKGIPNGTYRLEVPAFARVGFSANDYDLFYAQKDTTGAYIYATAGEKSATAPVALCATGAISENLADGSTSVGSSLYVPNTMSSAIAWFSAGYYVNALHIEVTDGTLRVGIKKDAVGDGDWVMMDGFKLIYLGTESKGIQDVVAADGQVVSVSVYGANGAQLNGMKKGLNIIRTVYANGAVKVKKVMVK